ncbi:unnamed protein product [Rhizophagus irregularis]|nr:unnamed protein product [Rhizophagus irregularis]
MNIFEFFFFHKDAGLDGDTRLLELDELDFILVRWLLEVIKAELRHYGKSHNQTTTNMGRSHKKTLVNRQNTRIVIEDHPDEANDHTPLFTLEAPLSSEEEEADSGNESGYASTIATGFGGSYVGNDVKWIDDTISHD